MFVGPICDMPDPNHILGVANFLSKLGKEAQRRSHAAEVGLKRCGALLLNESMKLVPVDTGFLRRSGKIVATGLGNTAVVQVGYSAAYSVFVHENLDVAHGDVFNQKYAEQIKAGLMKSRGPNQQAKFLEQPFVELRPEFLRIMKEEQDNAK